MFKITLLILAAFLFSVNSMFPTRSNDNTTAESYVNMKSFVKFEGIHIQDKVVETLIPDYLVLVLQQEGDT